MTVSKSYEAYKFVFDLRVDAKEKLRDALPGLSTIDALYNFHIARKGVLGGEKLNKQQRISLAFRSAVGLIPGVNLLLYLIMGYGTLACIAIDSVNKRKMAKSESEKESVTDQSETEKSITEAETDRSVRSVSDDSGVSDAEESKTKLEESDKESVTGPSGDEKEVSESESSDHSVSDSDPELDSDTKEPVAPESDSKDSEAKTIKSEEPAKTAGPAVTAESSKKTKKKFRIPLKSKKTKKQSREAKRRSISKVEDSPSRWAKIDTSDVEIICDFLKTKN